MTTISAEKINTYVDGFSIRPKDNILRKDIVKICETLSHIFQTKVEPEPIGSGFIFFKDLNYKSMRLFGGTRTQPFINENVMLEWKEDETCYLQANTFYSTFLKGFYNQKWTIEDLCEIADVFKQYNITVRNIPKKNI